MTAVGNLITISAHKINQFITWQCRNSSLTGISWTDTRTSAYVHNRNFPANSLIKTQSRNRYSSHYCHKSPPVNIQSQTHSSSSRCHLTNPLLYRGHIYHSHSRCLSEASNADWQIKAQTCGYLYTARRAHLKSRLFPNKRAKVHNNKSLAFQVNIPMHPRTISTFWELRDFH